MQNSYIQSYYPQPEKNTNNIILPTSLIHALYIIENSLTRRQNHFGIKLSFPLGKSVPF